MKLSKFFFLMFLITSVSLVYVQMQVQIFHLAYQGKKREKEITRLLDANGDVRSRICLLESSSHLGERLLDEKSSFQFLEKEQVIHLTLPKSPAGQIDTTSQSRSNDGGLLAGLFFSKSQAEAGPLEK